MTKLHFLMRTACFFFVGLIIFLSGCKPDVPKNDTDTPPAEVRVLQIINNCKLPLAFADSLVFIIAAADTAQKIDSVQVFLDNKWLENISKLPKKFIHLPTKVGKHTLKFTAYYQNKPTEALEFDNIVLSDIIPKIRKYEVVRTHPHNINAYTQGLEFDAAGNLYEGTGLEGKSMLQKISLPDGKILQQTPLPINYFGEGITIVNDKIIQLTWRNQKAIVYDKATLKPEKELYYATEGWGLAHTADNQLIMSDGTHRIYFVNAQSFGTERTIEIYNNIDKVLYINELEWIDGKIYANIYQTNQIATIDPATGRVIEYIDLSGLAAQLQNAQNADVLNGIAYNKRTKKLYVTGKLWDKIFEIRVL